MDLPDGVVVKYVAEDGKGMCLDPQTGQTAEDDADAICQASLRDYPEEVRHVGGTNGVWRASVYSTDGGGCNERIDCHNSKTGRNFSIGLQTPFCCLFIDDVTMLPDGKVVFKLDDLIVAADPECNRIAVLAHGKCPVAEKRECQK